MAQKSGIPALVVLATWLISCTAPSPDGLYLGPPGTSETHAVVEVQAGEVQGEVWRLHSVVSVGDAQADSLLPEKVPTSAISLPTTYAVVARNRTGTLTVHVEALDATGWVVGRGVGSVDLVAQDGVRLAITLIKPCLDAADCQDGVFCNGAERCVDGMCQAGERACPPSPVSCVAVSCLEQERQCTVLPNHAACPPFTDAQGQTDPAFCDPISGCARGEPCATDAECQDAFDCNGAERCVGGRCIGGQPPDVNDHDECTADACVEGQGIQHFPVTNGNACAGGICRDGACVVPRCGDGIFTSSVGEQCDDGNSVDGDGCTNACTLPRCGDGVLHLGVEACDDGNTVDGDGCDRGCIPTGCGNGIRDPQEGCDDGNLVDGDGCDSNCKPSGCGNGIRVDPEQCDDGNALDNDGCDSNCTLSRCGNGITAGDEACDDGNQVDNDGCTNRCTLPRCGDGIVQAGEGCDDGNAIDGDTCTAACQAARCGDGVVQVGVEGCDDGNTTDGDGCDRGCVPTGCGNGVKDATEQCDDGNLVDGDGCDRNCTVSRCGNGMRVPPETCDDGNTTDGDGCDSNCTYTRCGNGIKDASEGCDDGNLADGDGCDSNCQPSGCGNGQRVPPEVCDDGNRGDGDGCDSNCTLTRCGNGVLTAGEECDDGNSVDNDGCTNRCTLPRCGDAIVQAGEECDDGNTVDTDACHACHRNVCGDNVVYWGTEECDDGNASDADACLTTCRENRCGDGIRNALAEECDDGNSVEEDGCLSTCRLNTCGDGIRNPLAEECDDGNASDADSCLASCRLNVCGDGKLNPTTEVCDDGNTLSGDGCRGDCRKVERCGDGLLDQGEACDDGNTNSNDGCHACRTTAWTPQVLLGFGDGNGDPLQLRMGLVQGVQLDRAGNIFLADDGNERIWRMDTTTRKVTIHAGVGKEGYSGDGGPAGVARFHNMADIALDSVGNMYVADKDNHRVRKVDTLGIVTTVAGTGVPGFSGEGDLGIRAQLNEPLAVAVDTLGNVYVGDSLNHRVRKLDVAGVLTTVAGVGTSGYSGDGLAATAAELMTPVGLAVDSGGNLYISDLGASVVRVVDASGVIHTKAGRGLAAFGGDNGPATSAFLNEPMGVAVDATGNLYIADSRNYRVRKVAPAGTITTVLGGGSTKVPSSGSISATSADLEWTYDVTLDASNKLWVVDSYDAMLLKVDGTLVSRVAGVGGTVYNSEARTAQDGGQASSARTSWPWGLAVRDDGTLLMMDLLAVRLRSVTPAGVLGTVAGTGTRGTPVSGQLALSTNLDMPTDLARDVDQDVFLAMWSRVMRLAPDGRLYAYAGSGTRGYLGENTAALSARLGLTLTVGTDPWGNLFIADQENQRLRKVDTAGIIRTVAGTGVQGAGFTSPLAVDWQLNNPTGVAADSTGRVYFGDQGNHRVLRLELDGTLTVVAGTGVAGFNGDGISASTAQLDTPYDVAVDAADHLFIADRGNFRVRWVDGTGTIHTRAGTGVGGFSGDGGDAALATLSGPSGLAFDATGNLFIADHHNDYSVNGNNIHLENHDDSQVRKVSPAGIITTVAGPMFVGDGAFDGAALGSPSGLVNLGGSRWLVADGVEGRLRVADLSTSQLSTAAGYPAGFPITTTASSARFARPLLDAAGVAYDAVNHVAYVSERDNHVILRVDLVNPADASTWTVKVFTGVPGTAGFLNGALASARFSSPAGLAWDATARKLYVADAGNHVVRAIDTTTSLVSTYAGTAGIRGFFGDGGNAKQAGLNAPQALVLVPSGGMYIADTFNHRVRRVDGSNVISTVLGDGTAASSGVGTPARFFPVDTPRGLALDSQGNLFVSSRTSVRLVAAGADGVAAGDDPVSTIYGAAPRSGFPDAVTQCVTGLAVEPADDRVLVLDACQGFLLTLTRQSL